MGCYVFGKGFKGCFYLLNLGGLGLVGVGDYADLDVSSFVSCVCG